MTLVVDASALVAALVDGGVDGEWARDVLRARSLAAPGHVYVEVSNVLRRGVLAGALAVDTAALAHADLAALTLSSFPFPPLAERAWELHPTVTSFDAPYVALAEALDLPLVTLDLRLARASGPRCTFLTPQT